MQFRWIDWNVEHIAAHGVSPEEAEFVVKNAHPPYPEHRGDGKWIVLGKSAGGRFLQVVFIEDDDDSGSLFVIHSRPLTRAEKARFRKRIT